MDGWGLELIVACDFTRTMKTGPTGERRSRQFFRHRPPLVDQLYLR